MSRLKETYSNEIVAAMTKKFGYKNIMQVPKLDKIVINMGVGEAKDNAKLLDAAIKDLETIAGQKAVVTRARKSVANFKLREGMPIGCKVTLRGEKMYEFADRLINLALPRVRDLSTIARSSALGRRNTLTGRESLTRLRISNSLPALTSKMKPTPVASNSAKRTPQGSKSSDKPLPTTNIS